MRFRIGMLCLALFCLGLMLVATGCPSAGRDSYQRGLRAYDEGDYANALTDFDAALVAEPESVMAAYGRALTLFKLQRYEDAIEAFETFLAKSESERAVYQDERKDAAFYRDKCREALGIEIPQNERAIPPPPMGE
ncbi:MAG: tetratricopeptide repeat protein [bacterium]